MSANMNSLTVQSSPPQNRRGGDGSAESGAGRPGRRLARSAGAREVGDRALHETGGDVEPRVRRLRRRPQPRDHEGIAPSRPVLAHGPGAGTGSGPKMPPGSVKRQTTGVERAFRGPLPEVDRHPPVPALGEDARQRPGHEVPGGGQLAEEPGHSLVGHWNLPKHPEIVRVLDARRPELQVGVILAGREADPVELRQLGRRHPPPAQQPEEGPRPGLADGDGGDPSSGSKVSVMTPVPSLPGQVIGLRAGWRC